MAGGWLRAILGLHRPAHGSQSGLSPVLQMYDNIALLRFNDGDGGEKLASAMISAEGEVMEFRKIIRAEGRVEDWMTAVLNEMRRTNRLITKEAIFRYCEDRSR